jgi:hypothetical protein
METFSDFSILFRFFISARHFAVTFFWKSIQADGEDANAEAETNAAENPNDRKIMNSWRRMRQFPPWSVSDNILSKHTHRRFSCQALRFSAYMAMRCLVPHRGK